jgi:RimJ/RimL family protein N-acetyltransferase
MFQEILTERLCLRSLQRSDAEKLFAYRCHPQVIRFQSWEPQSVEEVAEFIENMSTRKFNEPGWYQIAIVLKDDGSLIGDSGIHILEDDSRIAEIGITIDPASQSKGYATEALTAILDLLFDKLEKHRIIASVDPRNLPSLALMERTGLRKEGHFVKSLWFKNDWADDVTFAMLAQEWKTKKGADSFL